MMNIVRILIGLSFVGLSASFTPKYGTSIVPTIGKSSLFVQSSQDELQQETQQETPQPSSPQPEGLPPLDPFTQKLIELYEYKERHGDLLVPKRCPENPSLGHFVCRTRQLYKRYLANETTNTLTDTQVDLLNRLGFVWDASNSTPFHNYPPAVHDQPPDEPFWEFHTQFNETIHSRLVQLQDSHGLYRDPESGLEIPKRIAILQAVSEITPRTPLGKWLGLQRKQFDSQKKSLHPERVQSLSSIDQYWHLPPRERVWRIRYSTLIAYQKEYGDTAVPSTFRSQTLATWVFNQRKHYKLKRQGKMSNLTNRREKLLEEIGFIWDVWEYKFKCKNVETVGDRSR